MKHRVKRSVQGFLLQRTSVSLSEERTLQESLDPPERRTTRGLGMRNGLPVRVVPVLSGETQGLGREVKFFVDGGSARHVYNSTRTRLSGNAVDSGDPSLRRNPRCQKVLISVWLCQGPTPSSFPPPEVRHREPTSTLFLLFPNPPQEFIVNLSTHLHCPVSR